MRSLKVFDNISKIERTVTQKAYDIITKNKRNPRYKFLAYVDENGQEIGGEVPAAPEKKTESLTEQSPEKSAVPAEGETPAQTELPSEGITVIKKKPGPKPKNKNAEE